MGNVGSYYDGDTTMIQEEHFNQWYEEAYPMFVAQYGELCWRQEKIKLKVRYDLYQSMVYQNLVHAYVSRTDSGTIDGYALWVLTPSLHYADIMVGNNDIIYVDPQHRGYGLIHKLLNFSETELHKVGCNVLSLHIKMWKDWSMIAERHGYEKTEFLLQKWIGD